MSSVAVLRTGPLRVALFSPGAAVRASPLSARGRTGCLGGRARMPASPPKGIREPGRTPAGLSSRPPHCVRGPRQPLPSGACLSPRSGCEPDRLRSVGGPVAAGFFRTGRVRRRRSRGYRRPCGRSCTRAGRQPPGTAPAGAALLSGQGRRVPGAVPLGRQPGTRRVPLPGGSRVAALQPSGIPPFPAGLAAVGRGPGWSPLVLQPGGPCPPEVPVRRRPGAPLWHQDDTMSVPVFRMYEEPGPRLPTTFCQLFPKNFSRPPLPPYRRGVSAGRRLARRDRPTRDRALGGRRAPGTGERRP
jgi:hypothetical protein